MLCLGWCGVADQLAAPLRAALVVRGPIEEIVVDVCRTVYNKTYLQAWGNLTITIMHCNNVY